MTKYIVHIGTGTIINADECVVVDLDKLDDHDSEVFDAGWDDEIIEVAQRVGEPLPQDPFSQVSISYQVEPTAEEATK